MILEANSNMQLLTLPVFPCPRALKSLAFSKAEFGYTGKLLRI